MLVLDYRILPHHFHRKYPIAISTTAAATLGLHPHLKHLPKRALTNHPHNLKITRAHLLHLLTNRFLAVTTRTSTTILFTRFVFISGGVVGGRIVELIWLEWREGSGEGYTR
ncbi:hypothetical protein ABFS83_09G028000 [Erythranthe nasuta]